MNTLDKVKRIRCTTAGLKANYKEIYLAAYNIVYDDFDRKNLEVILKFDDGQYATMKLSTFIVNMIFFRPYVQFNKPITADLLFDTNRLSETTLTNKFNLIVASLFDDPEVILTSLSVCLSHMIELLVKISRDFCWIIGNSLDLVDLIETSVRNSRFNEIIHHKFDEKLETVKSIEPKIVELNKEIISIIINDKDSRLRPFLMAEGNINRIQLSQVLVSIGGRSDLHGNVLSAFINTNFLMGMRSAADYFIESYSSKKALIANHYQMSDSGYTLRQTDLLTVDVRLDQSINDCGNQRTIPVELKDYMLFSMFWYKFYQKDCGVDGKPIWSYISPRDTHLIGTLVHIRSSMECCAPQGHICQTCYGLMHRVIRNYHSGILGSHAVMHHIEQMVLSTKHLLITKSKKKEFDDVIKKYFTCTEEAIKLSPQIADKYHVEIGLMYDDVEDLMNAYNEEMEGEKDDEDYTPNMLVNAIGRFKLHINGEEIAFHRDEPDLYINYGLLEKMVVSDKYDDDYVYVDLNSYGSDRSIFDLNIENIEVTVYLKKIMTMFGIKSNMRYTDYKALFYDFLEILHELGHNVNICHVETLIYNLIREPLYVTRRPNMAGVNPIPYTLLALPKAILKSNNITTSLSFERIRNQFDDPLTYMKDGKGYMDSQYK